MWLCWDLNLQSLDMPSDALLTMLWSPACYLLNSPKLYRPFQLHRPEKRFCKQCRSRWEGSYELSHQYLHCLPFFSRWDGSYEPSHQDLHCLPFFYFVTTLFAILFSIFVYAINGHIQFQRWMSPLQKLRGERVKDYSILTCIAFLIVSQSWLTEMRKKGNSLHHGIYR